MVLRALPPYEREAAHPKCPPTFVSVHSIPAIVYGFFLKDALGRLPSMLAGRRRFVSAASTNALVGLLR